MSEQTTKKTRKSTKKAEETKTEQVTNEQAEPNVELEPVSLTVQDLNALSTIIDVACQRGAFKGDEMENVGKVFNKLGNFLAQIKKQTEEAAEEETSEAEAE